MRSFIDFRQKLKQLPSYIMQALTPPNFIIALALPSICILMAWVFLLGSKEHPLAYVAYVASAYLLTVFCIWMVRHFPRKALRALASKNRLTSRALEDIDYRRQVFITFGLGVDMVWAGVNLVGGVLEASIWLLVSYPSSHWK